MLEPVRIRYKDVRKELNRLVCERGMTEAQALKYIKENYYESKDQS